MTATVGAQLNVLDPVLYAGDPYPAYQWLRDEAPVYWDPVNEIWAVSRHRDVLAIERDPARYSSARGSRPLIEMTASMINRDDPRHQQQRKLVSAAVLPARGPPARGPDPRPRPRAGRGGGREGDRRRGRGSRRPAAGDGDRRAARVRSGALAQVPGVVGADDELGRFPQRRPAPAGRVARGDRGVRRRPSASWRRPAGPTRGTTWCPPGCTAPSTASRWTCRS